MGRHADMAHGPIYQEIARSYSFSEKKIVGCLADASPLINRR
jgi:hypothetical protein